MLSREERIFSELLLARGLVARDFIEGFAKKRSRDDSEPSLAEFLIDSGGLGREQAEETLEEARAIDATLAPHLEGGARLGDFLLIRELGRGGMGIVYEAEQESLGRRVALKVLPAGAALDERLAIRFLREARAAGRLHHPGIVPIFASGRAEGVLFFAMELVEGRSLAEVVAEGPVAPERAARLAAEIARALEHAHEAELIHRDVKPENILLAADGRARLTDFGLVHESVASSFTLPRHVLGTPAYMAPEQALGNAVDRRSDIYALGAVLYTLLGGKPPYGGDLPSVVLSRVLSGPPPPLRTVKGDIPPSLAAICERAMAREPADRYGTARELAEDLEAFGRGEAPAAQAATKRSRKAGWLLGAAASIAAGAVIAALSMHGGPPAPVAVAPVPGPKFVLVNATPGAKDAPVFSPDGKFLAYAIWREQGWSLWIEDLATREVSKLSEDGTSPVFSPDGRHVAFAFRGVIHAVDLGSGTRQQIGGPGLGTVTLTWSPDGREIATAGRADDSGTGSSSGRISAVDVASGRVRVVRSMDARNPAYSPHGSRIAFVSHSGGAADVWTVPPRGGDAVRVTNDPAADWSPFWSRDGRRIYFGSDRNGTPALWSAGVDEASGLPLGNPEPPFVTAFPAAFEATLSADGTRMAIVSAGERGRMFRFPFDPGSGSLLSSPVAMPRHPGASMFPQPSPDGKLLVYTAFTPDEDLAIVGADGTGEPRFVTDDGFEDRAPRWSPDGERIAFHSNRSGNTEVWTVRMDGSELQQITRTANGKAVYPVWSPDGKRLAFSIEGVGAALISTLPDTAGGSPEELPPPSEGAPFEPWCWSPDGKTLAGSARGIVLYSIRDRGYRRITDFGEKPVWLDDGRRLLFVSDRSIFLADVGGGAPRQIYSAAPSALPPFLSVADRGRSIYASLAASREEIWIGDLPK